jgi:hypothetical protein
MIIKTQFLSRIIIPGGNMSSQKPVVMINAALNSFHNKKDLEENMVASCYYCCRIFLRTQIVSFVDNGATAICPHCGVDSVISGAIPQEELNKISRMMFSYSYEVMSENLPVLEEEEDDPPSSS